MSKAKNESEKISVIMEVIDPQEQQKNPVEVNNVRSEQTPPPCGKPSNHLVGAVLATICCCLPCGIVAIVYASQVDTLWYSGNYDGAYKMSHKAGKWMRIAIFWPFIIYGIAILIVLSLGVLGGLAGALSGAAPTPEALP